MRQHMSHLTLLELLTSSRITLNYAMDSSKARVQTTVIMLMLPMILYVMGGHGTKIHHQLVQA